MKFLQNTVLVLVSLTAALTAAELFLQSVSPDEYFVLPPGFRQQFEPVAEIMPGVEGPSLYTTNAAGTRGRDVEQSDSMRILAVGGSTTECLYLDDAEAWPWLLQARLNDASGQPNWWVGNVGRSGHTTRNHVWQARKLLEQDESIDILLLMAGINDLALRLQLDNDWLPISQESERYRQKIFYRSFAVIPPMVAELPFFQRLALWQQGRRIRRLRDAQKEQTDIEDVSGSHYRNRRQARAAALELREELPDLSEALAEFESNVRSIIAHAGDRGVAVVLLTQPAMWRDDLPASLQELLWFGYVNEQTPGAGRAYYTVAAMRAGLDMYNGRLLTICRDTDAVCIDVDAELARDTSVFYDDVHFNEAGAVEVARVVAEGLEQSRYGFAMPPAGVR